ncbi:MAG TPA: cupin domain-containing protein [Candidatus Sumerlaeota bacterium]|nr:cupin domain-containing protein [Candidatus Sumerlaeota bacterium]
MNIIRANETQPGPNPHGVDVRKLLETDHALAVQITLQPGQSLKRHITPVDVFFFVLEGQGIVEVGEEKQEVGPDTLIESPRGIPHCWYNEGDKPLRVLVVKTPRPTSNTRLL